MRALLEPAAAYIAAQPVIGLWPVSVAQTLLDILSGDGRHSMLAFAHAIGARPAACVALTNINTPGDLAAVEQTVPSL
ncbi:MAG TPA: hypothetical protein VHG29_13005 [Novosphingobium sp.]|nr:hypothetical protein [Novosphingobium sp.]